MTEGRNPRSGGKGVAYGLLGVGILIILGGGIGLESALSHQRGPSAARAANRAAASGRPDASPVPSAMQMP